VSPSFTALLGYSRADIPTLPECFEKLFPDPAYRRLIVQEWRESVQHFERNGQAGAPVLTRVRCKDGSQRFLESRTAIADNEIIVTLNDITERVHAEAQQRAATAERDDLLRRLRSQAEALPLGLIVADASEALTLRAWNPAAERIFGFKRDEVLGKSPPESTLPRAFRAQVEEWMRTKSSGETLHAECETRKKDGHTIHCEWFVTLLGDKIGAVSSVMVMVQDVSERVAADERLRTWAHVLEHSAEGIFICDPNERILLVNAAFQRITGFSAEEVIGKTPRVLGSGLQKRPFYVELWKTLATTGRWQGEIWNRRKNDEFYVEWLSISAVRRQDGRIEHYVGIFSDITERKVAEERVAHLAHYDALTDLPNRALLIDRLGQAIKAAERHGSKVAAIFVDLDRFKAINDSLGHDTGDELLQTVAKRLGAAMRAHDTVARMGGDEFVVVLPELQHSRDAVTVAHKLIEALAHPLNLQGHEITVTASMGISVYPDDAADVHDLLRNADAAMYEAKAAGRNAYRFYTSDMNRRALEVLSVESALRRALDRAEFALHYQPQIDLESRTLIGAEALIRWAHPEKGFVSPGTFIPIAEERGLITPIGEWVVGEATRQLARWASGPLAGLSVAVNLSSIQFHQSDFVESIARAIEANGVDPTRLELELTESIVMRDAESTILILKRLHEMGLLISIDDFGTGYSSLNYLRRFPIHKIKIDQSFVREMVEDPDTASIVNGIIGLAKSLKLKVIAEGVENDAQLGMLREQGCHEAQGFLFSKALPAAEFEAFVQRWTSAS
jgi:diguanylate cyclase (GGDEF)-like protein/PAS domain S-box-containing protein